MNILFLADLAQPDAAGGAQTVAWELARQLVARGHGVTFLVTAAKGGKKDTDVIDSIRIHRLPETLSPWRLIRQRRQLATALAWQQRVDLVHSHFAYAEPGVSGVLPARIPWVRSFYGPWDEEGWVEDSTGKSGLLLKARLKRWMRRRIEQTSLRRAKRVVYLSEFSRTQLQETGVASERFRCIPGGADIQRFYPSGTREQARKLLGLPGDGQLLLSIRRLVPRMGLDRLIDAMLKVNDYLPNARLIIGGRGPESVNLQRKIDELGLQSKVRLAGFIPDELLADYYRAADLFVLPTTALEGFGLVTVDALASGTPVLGTPAGATPEILNRLDSRLVTSGVSASQIADGILRFFREDWRLALTPERLHDLVRNHYTWQLHTEAVLAVYDEVFEKFSRS